MMNIDILDSGLTILIGLMISTAGWGIIEYIKKQGSKIQVPNITKEEVHIALGAYAMLLDKVRYHSPTPSLSPITEDKIKEIEYVFPLVATPRWTEQLEIHKRHSPLLHQIMDSAKGTKDIEQRLQFYLGNHITIRARREVLGRALEYEFKKTINMSTNRLLRWFAKVVKSWNEKDAVPID